MQMTIGSINKTFRPRILQRVFAYREVVPFALLIVVLIVSMSLSSSFRDLAYLLRISTRYMELGMAALTMTLIITAGMIDLSVPAVMCCSATLTALLLHVGAPMGLAIVLGMLTGAVWRRKRYADCLPQSARHDCYHRYHEFVSGYFSDLHR